MAKSCKEKKGKKKTKNVCILTELLFPFPRERMFIMHVNRECTWMAR
jgi:hypothetical protein